MKQVVVSFVDLSSDKMEEILSIGELWYTDTQVNSRSFNELVSRGRLNELPGEVSTFPEGQDPKTVLRNVFLHYSPYSFSGPFSGSRDFIKIIGCPLEVVRMALKDNLGIAIKIEGNEVWIIQDGS